jgi:hypothetical protein
MLLPPRRRIGFQPGDCRRRSDVALLRTLPLHTHASLVDPDPPVMTVS